MPKVPFLTYTLITRSFTDILFPPEASCIELSWERNLQKNKHQELSSVVKELFKLNFQRT